MGLFASRAFVPAFAAAFILRFGPEVPWLNELGLLGLTGIEAAPSWFTSDWCIIALAALATIEVMAAKNAEARDILGLIDKYFKPVMAAITTLGVAISVEDQQFLEEIRDGMEAALVPAAAGFTLASLTWGSVLAAVAAVGTFITATVREFFVSLFSDLDVDDDTGAQKLLSWAEDVWSLFGLWFLILFPFLMLALIGLVMGMIFLLRWWFWRKEEASRVPCESCGQLMYRCAIRCGHCGTQNPRLCDVGLFGQSDRDDPADPIRLPFKLAESRRCPVCATRLDARHPRQHCDRCGHDPFADAGFVRAYANRIAGRVPTVLILSGVLGAIYIVGVIPAVIYYRLTLVAPFSRYIPRGRSLVMRWGLRLAFFLLLASQLVPFLGMITIPVMALMSHLAYRRLFLSLTDDVPVNDPPAKTLPPAAPDRAAPPDTPPAPAEPPATETAS